LKATTQSEHVLQMSTTDERGAPLLSVLVKRTYVIDGSSLAIAPEQVPLLPLRAEEDEPEVVIDEADIWPYKRLTDVVVRGHAYMPGDKPEGSAQIAVGELVKEMVVIGDRRASLHHGQVVFSEPARVEKVALSYRNAYGGVDRVAEAKYGNPYAAMQKYLSPMLRQTKYSPYRYPRNGVGKGFLIEATPEALEAITLPNLEDHADRLTPSRLPLGSPLAWPRAPLPWCTDWASLGTFPRYAYLGGAPEHEPLPDDFPEVRRGFLAKGYPRRGTRPEEICSDRVFNAGSLGLQMGPLTAASAASSMFRLQNLHPKRREVNFRLPAGAPVIKTAGRDGKLASTDPVLHHVVIEPDLDRVSVVWRGASPALRRYDMAELAEMPLEVTW
jgi:hypothetical protein